MSQKHHRPRFTAFAASSIDGRISLAKKIPPDWTSREDWMFFQDALSRMDAVVVGRNTYASARTRLQKRVTFVLSHRVGRTTRRGSVTFLNPEKTNLCALFAKFKNIGVLGGSRVYGWMIENAMLDEFFVTIEPLVFGRGAMLIEGMTTVRYFRLRSCRRLNKSTLLLHYEIL